jgi:aspartyl-tRNA(Asn)/glutamyl-tRNA(Gln) amidotransferase subunit A
MYLNDIYTISVNLAGLPAMSIPAGFDASGLPVGLHLIGQYFDEASLLNVAHRYQQATDWHLRTPEAS